MEFYLDFVKDLFDSYEKNRFQEAREVEERLVRNLLH